MKNVVKVRIYPTVEQKQVLLHAFGCARWYWNNSLNTTNELYKETGKGLSQIGMNSRLPALKKEYEWLGETYSQVLQSVSLKLSRAFVNFSEGRASFPNFKSLHDRQSIQYPQKVQIVDGSHLKFPGKLGVVSAKIHRTMTGKIKTVTVSMNHSRKYYASLLFDDELPDIEISSEGKAVGIDVGLTHFAITSDGSKFDNPKPLKKRAKNLLRKQQKLSRKVKGSNRRKKARRIVARVHERIANSRRDFQHKLSRHMVNENQVIIVENLAVKNMVSKFAGRKLPSRQLCVKNHCLAKAISDCGWSEFTRQLKYKAERDGKTYLEIGRFFPSSKTCHVCLNQVGSLSVDIRSWTCANCNTKHDRDVNAAINIRDEGLRLLALGTSATANGRNVSPRVGRKSSVSSAFPVEIGSLHHTA